MEDLAVAVLVLAALHAVAGAGAACWPGSERFFGWFTDRSGAAAVAVASAGILASVALGATAYYRVFTAGDGQIIVLTIPHRRDAYR